jgi:murB family protein
MEEIKNNLLCLEEINAYLDMLYKIKNDVTIVISVKDTPGSCMPESVLDKIRKLGFSKFSKDLWKMYTGVLHNGNSILDYEAREEEKIEVDIEVENMSMHLISAPWRNGNRASIVINRIDYACNRRGVNIVVYDAKSDMPIDSVYYDSHGKNGYFSREKKIFEKKKWLDDKQTYDVCVVGFWYGANYGSLLNGYATYKILKNLGKKVVMLRKPDHITDDMELKDWTHNTKFVNSVYSTEDISPRMSRNDIGLLNEHVNTFLAGSDQIWNYKVSFSGFMYLPFVENAKRRISFCTSFGDKNDNVPSDKVEFVKKEFHKYDAISVREDFGKENLKNKYNVDSTVLLEPVFDIERKEYDNLIKDSVFEEKEPYIVAYILDPTDEKLNIINQVSKTMGCKIITIPDGYYTIIRSTWDSYIRKEEFPNLQINMGAKDFLKACSKAEFVVTDSFHGSCFSIIFEKKFISICNSIRGAERFYDLLGRFNLLNRLVTNANKFKWKDEYLNDIDYETIDKQIEEDRNRSVEWLKNALDTSKSELPELKKLDRIDKCVIQTCDMELCVGCGACFSACPNSAISMGKNDFGYYKPMIDIEKCINCGVCTRVCPAINEIATSNSETPECYEVISADEKILEKSSSGGAFSLLAHAVFEKGGCVFGAAWTEDFSVEHIMIENEDDMYKLRKSKYLQSYVGDTFRKVKEKLEEGKYVLFSGCPCQAAGLRQYLGSKEYDNLLIVDLLCANAPSPDFFKKYIQDSYGNNIEKYEFRDKTYGWNCVTTKVTFIDGTIHMINKAYQSDYQRVFHNHAMCSYHCENCKYQNVPKIGDITIGDFWGINSNDKEVDSSKGISALLVNNEKAKVFFNNINEDKFKVKKQVPFEWLKGNGFTVKGTHNFVSPRRRLFYDAIRTMPFSEAVNYALKPNYGKYKQDESLFYYHPEKTIFSFNENIWEEHIINGAIYLYTKLENSPSQKYARLALNKLLLKGKKYELHIKFKVNTEGNCYNLHIKDSGSNYYQIIWTERVDSQNRGKWIDRTIIFVPDANIFDEFMVGAAQLVGEGSYIAFSLIDIREVY